MDVTFDRGLDVILASIFGVRPESSTVHCSNHAYNFYAQGYGHRGFYCFADDATLCRCFSGPGPYFFRRPRGGSQPLRPPPSLEGARPPGRWAAPAGSVAARRAHAPTARAGAAPNRTRTAKQRKSKRIKAEPSNAAASDMLFSLCIVWQFAFL